MHLDLAAFLLGSRSAGMADFEAMTLSANSNEVARPYEVSGHVREDCGVSRANPHDLPIGRSGDLPKAAERVPAAGEGDRWFAERASPDLTRFSEARRPRLSCS
jgi:hypothetical protein